MECSNVDPFERRVKTLLVAIFSALKSANQTLPSAVLRNIITHHICTTQHYIKSSEMFPWPSANIHANCICTLDRKLIFLWHLLKWALCSADLTPIPNPRPTMGSMYSNVILDTTTTTTT